MLNSYQKGLDYLYQFSNLENRHLDAPLSEYVSLERPRQLLALLGDPQRQFRSIHVAGTNGKGSVAAMLANTLRLSGYKTGLYTSPHLSDLRERVRVVTSDDEDGQINKADFLRQVNRIRQIADQVQDVTWYELVTALAFLHFADMQIDAAVVEVGLGGRLDASNVLTPLLSVITSISLDHTYLLGDTLAEIAAEKGGIIKPAVPVVVAPQRKEAFIELARIAEQGGSRLIDVAASWAWRRERSDDGALPRTAQSALVTISADEELLPSGRTVEIGLLGNHQLDNGMTAVAALSEVKRHFPGITEDTVREGLRGVRWPGRMQLLKCPQQGTRIVVDAAHNTNAVSRLVQSVADQFSYRRLLLVVGITADKDSSTMLGTLLSAADWTVVVQASHPRAAEVSALKEESRLLGFEVEVGGTVLEGLYRACGESDQDDLILVTGSLFVAGDLLGELAGGLASNHAISSDIED